MPEINPKNIVKKTRDEIHQEDVDRFDENLQSRQIFHSEDVLQVAALHEQITKLQLIAKNNCQNIEKLTNTMNKLLPIVPIIPTVENIVKNQEATTIIGRKILRIIGYISAIIGLLYLVFRFWHEIKN